MTHVSIKITQTQTQKVLSPKKSKKKGQSPDKWTKNSEYYGSYEYQADNHSSRLKRSL